jgi:hypothetical protein
LRATPKVRKEDLAAGALWKGSCFGARESLYNREKMTNQLLAPKPVFCFLEWTFKAINSSNSYNFERMMQL